MQLAKPREDVREVVCVYAYAAVTDMDHQQVQVRLIVHFDLNLADGCELERVLCQINQDLLQASRIAKQHLR